MLGIRCYAAIRPNSRTLSVHQGKGTNDNAAKLSAIMEAVEFAFGESPAAPRQLASLNDLQDAGLSPYWPERALPRDFDRPFTLAIPWLAGYRLGSGTPVLVPLDSVAIAPNASEKLPFAQSSNGLAAGFDEPEAIVHGLCELIERDASTLWSLRPLNHCAGTAIDLDAVEDNDVQTTLEKFAARGMTARAFDLTTDLGLPVIMALLWSDAPKLYFDVASGVCAHPAPVRALLGALEEAAQTRISNIAGARDDIAPSEYNRPVPGWLLELIGKARSSRPLPLPLSPENFAQLPHRLDDTPIAVPLSTPESGISVVKILSSQLEDRATNVHWRPGPRAIRAMTAL